MRFAGAATAVLSICGTIASPLVPRQGQAKIRGVNLGGWLVLEPWITPSLFSGGELDEWELSSKAADAIKSHWSSFITQADFQAIAGAGLTHVRIPIGYWAYRKLDGDPYISGQDDYLDRAIGWAESAGLKVIIDLHGAPGSQNGYDNSGHRGAINWQQGDNVKTTLEILGEMAKKYANRNGVDGIELLNEPLGPQLDVGGIRQFSKDGWGRVRDAGGNVKVFVHDAFQNPSSWTDKEFTDNGKNVYLDHHHYQVFTAGQIQQSATNQFYGACASTEEYKGYRTAGLVVGEWSGALTDCAPLLNGVNRGARYEGQYDNSPRVGSCDQWRKDYSEWTEQMRSDVGRFISAQVQNFERSTQGWFFWTWKAEDAPEWDMQRLLKAGLFPSVASISSINVCG